MRCRIEIPLAVMVFAVWLAQPARPAPGGPQSAAALTLENRFLALKFDGWTGDWTGFVDRATGENLAVGVAQLVPEGLTKPPSQAAIQGAVASGTAVPLEGDWQFAPTGGAAEADMRAGRYGRLEWRQTPVPSRRGVGDDLLHDRQGDFYYRTTFIIPPGLAGRDLVLLIGAVDDFDTTWVNGMRVGTTGAETPHHWETPRFYRVPRRALTAGENRLLIKVTNGGYDGGIFGPVVIGDPARLQVRRAEPPPLLSQALNRVAGASRLTLAARSGGFEYRTTFTLPNDQASFTRQTEIVNTTAAPLALGGTTAALPALRVGPAQAALLPGSERAGDSPVAQMEEGQTLGSRDQDPLAVLWDAGKRRGVGSWYHCEEEFSPVALRGLGDGAEIRHTQQIVATLKPGEKVTLGTQYVWLTHGSREQVIAGVQQVYRAIGLRAPDHALAGLRRMVMYCGHPGGTAEMGFRGYGGFQAVTSYLPTLAKMHMDLLWLLPIWEHGDGQRWNLYSPFDHFKVSPLYGSPTDLKQLSVAAGEQRMLLMCDLVPHGPPDFTPLAKEHPEWVCRGPDGKLVYAWGQLAFDNANPGWQDYFRRAAAFDAKEYAAYGARVDCGAGGPLNYSPDAGHRPSECTLAAGLGMSRAIREGFLREHHEVVVMPEEYTGANLFYRVSDLTYDAQLFFLMMALEERHATPPEWASSLQRFLADQQLSLPPGALKMRFVSNHDTVTWTFQKKRPRAAYGEAKARALLALCGLIDGVPMLYQGDEDPALYGGKGERNVEYLARIYGARKKIAAFGGPADYSTVRASDGVFACLRGSGKERALVLISFNPLPVETKLDAGGAGAPKGLWCESLPGERGVTTADFRSHPVVRMAPYQVRILTPNR